MTAEIAILNKSAVALAADSAVTLQTPNGQKIYNTVNKLFTLSKFGPVGVMVYGGAEFMGLPWESIIKEHRRELGTTKFNTLREYVSNFLSWLAKAKLLFPESNQKILFDDSVSAYFQGIRAQITDEIEGAIAKNGSIDGGKINSVVDDVIEHHHSFWTHKAKLPSLPEDFENSIAERHRDDIATAIRAIFERLPISESSLTKLKAIAAMLFARDHFTDARTGIVIAGFGEQEIFPSVVSCTIDAVMDDKLKWKEAQSAEITLRSNAAIIPFAQREMVDTFLSGIDPNLANALGQAVELLLKNTAEQVFAAIPEKALPNKAESLAALEKSFPQILERFTHKVREYGRQQHILPVMNAVGALPKDELAAMAESLVNLTSFKRRISTDMETVGGQIDVAVISKGDGFIWIKRKHYFDPSKNPHFMVNCYRERAHES